MAKNFTKPALSNSELIESLKQRGLKINNPQATLAKLQSTGYYRFSAYWSPFFQPGPSPKQFKANTSFAQLWELYNFDSELRCLVYAALEKIEIALRAAINDHMCVKYKANWYQDLRHFRNKYYHEIFMQQVYLICKEREEPFIRHYYTHYSYPEYPPGWMIMECLTFGACSNVFQNLKNLTDLKEICKIFKRHPTVIESWIDSLRYTRNICAHHGRLWNRWFIIRPRQPKDNWLIQSPPRSLHEQINVILHLLACLEQKEAWQDKLYNLFASYPDVPYELMGFASKWRLDPIWQLPS
eukprot:TRINITY_DN17089_c0_g1_i1.p1 TRINITY_DN17089_c0_g1~~TRINITY_DN17089_c0_g1_i1.p1  ORF type:complete len:298 (+),score=-33.03 TRINITY_DN17089_c0_g1_i1:324-1217(+)